MVACRFSLQTQKTCTASQSSSLTLVKLEVGSQVSEMSADRHRPTAPATAGAAIEVPAAAHQDPALTQQISMIMSQAVMPLDRSCNVLFSIKDRTVNKHSSCATSNQLMCSHRAFDHNVSAYAGLPQHPHCVLKHVYVACHTPVLLP